MSTFITGGTGYLGGYVVDRLLRADPDEHLDLLVRCKTQQEGKEKLWRALQLHRNAELFFHDLHRIRILQGDLHAESLGIDPEVARETQKRVTSVLHIAASLNRKSEKACLNTNLRGTLSTIRFAQGAARAGSLRRFSHVSTVAVAGVRQSECVYEDEAIDWNRSDYDPYARTKKFCEHMVRQLLPDTSLTFFRPSIVLGDSEKHHTTQFDMLRAVAVLADLPVLPIQPTARVDIVPADYVARAITQIHQQPGPAHRIYHLSAGAGSPTVQTIARALENSRHHRPYRFAPALERPFGLAFKMMNALPRRTGLQSIGALMKVFWPYVTFDTVFDNQRVVEALDGIAPTPFPQYADPLLRFGQQHRFKYPYRPYPKRPRANAGDRAGTCDVTLANE